MNAIGSNAKSYDNGGIFLSLAQLLIVPAIVLTSSAAYAAGNSIEQVMCNVILIMTGTTGKAIATVCIIALGAGALFGKVSWNAAMLAVLGAGLLFGAASVVADLGAGSLTLVLGLEGDTYTHFGTFTGNDSNAPSTCSAGTLLAD
jgi:type IV secretory pathway VirB2 component (pilin)